MAQVLLKGKPVHTSGDLPAVKSKAPDFVLIDGELKERSLKDYKGKKKLLSIVPSLDTSTCSLSTKKFNEVISTKKDTVALIISMDLPFAQKRVCSTEHYDNVIPLSMMRSKRFAEDYGVLLLDGPIAGLTTRAILVLDENDRVLYTELVSEISQEPNYERALSFLQ